MLRTVYGQASFATLLIVAVAALVYGGRTERAGAAVLFVGALLGMALQTVSRQIDPALNLLASDGLILLGLTALTWRSSRRWPFVAVALQGVCVAVHAIRLLTHGMNAWTYLTAVAATGYGVMAALAVGVWQARRETRRRFSS